MADGSCAPSEEVGPHDHACVTTRGTLGASAYGEAETALMTAMPSITREAARHGDSAWR